MSVLAMCCEKVYPPLRDTFALSRLVHREEAVDFEFNRGCSHGRCAFCAMAFRRFSCGEKGRHYHRPIPQVITDLRDAYACGARMFNCLSEDLIPDPDEPEELQAVDEFIEALIQLRREGIVFQFFITARARSVFVEHDDQGNAARIRRYQRLREAGCVLVYLGIESGNDEQLKRRYGKDSSVHENDRALAILDGLGYTVCEGMIMFDPLMTDPQEILENIAFMRQLNFLKGPHQRSSVFVRCRVQAHSFLAQRIRSVERDRKMTLLGPLDIDRLEYPVIRYVNPDIFAVTEAAQAWQAPAERLMRSLRDFFRRAFIAQEICAVSQAGRSALLGEGLVPCARAIIPYFSGLRLLDIELLEEATGKILTTQGNRPAGFLDELLTRYGAIRLALISGLEKRLQCLGAQAETERIRVAIHEFCAAHPDDVGRAQGVQASLVATYLEGRPGAGIISRHAAGPPGFPAGDAAELLLRGETG